MQFDSIIAAVVSGKVDFGMSGFTITEERMQSVDFSTPYTTAKQSVIVPEGSAITSVDDLFNPENTFNIGVQIGTTGDLYITDDVEANGLKHIPSMQLQQGAGRHRRAELRQGRLRHHR